jgi:hypothetical protein
VIYKIQTVDGHTMSECGSHEDAELERAACDASYPALAPFRVRVMRGSSGGSAAPASDHYDGEADYVHRLSMRWPRHLVVCLAQVIRYVSRAGIKTGDPRQDLRKARWWIDRAIRLHDDHAGESGCNP